jgi:SAM-dependent methyltransferase
VRRPAFVARQSRCPTGLLGRLIGYIMSAETAEANAEALTILDLQPGDRVLDVGCGHGRTIEHAATSVAVGLVAGIDRSEEMARMAARRCLHLLREGRAGVMVSDSAYLPFRSRRFDKALSVHTVYFWRDPKAHLREIRRVLRDGGRFVLGCRPKGDAGSEDFPESVYTFYTAEEVRGLLEASGFERVDITHAPSALIMATGCAAS